LIPSKEETLAKLFKGAFILIIKKSMKKKYIVTGKIRENIFA